MYQIQYQYTQPQMQLPPLDIHNLRYKIKEVGKNISS